MTARRCVLCWSTLQQDEIELCEFPCLQFVKSTEFDEWFSFHPTSDATSACSNNIANVEPMQQVVLTRDDGNNKLQCDKNVTDEDDDTHTERSFGHSAWHSPMTDRSQNSECSQCFSSDCIRAYNKDAECPQMPDP